MKSSALLLWLYGFIVLPIAFLSIFFNLFFSNEVDEVKKCKSNHFPSSYSTWQNVLGRPGLVITYMCCLTLALTNLNRTRITTSDFYSWMFPLFPCLMLSSPNLHWQESECFLSDTLCTWQNSVGRNGP